MTIKNTPPQPFLPVLIHIKDTYILWHKLFSKIPKAARYSIGLKIDNLFVETIELVSIATFLQKTEKLPYLKKATAKIDTIKVFVQILWEMKAVETKEYAEIGEKIDSSGKMLGGWRGQIEKQLEEKQNSPTSAR